MSKRSLNVIGKMRDHRRDVLKHSTSFGFSIRSSQNTVLRFLPLILLPFLLVVIDDSWTFLAPTGFIDSYIYTGYFLDLQNHLRTFAQTYYSSRLPWIFIGSLAYRLPSVELANLLLRFLLFYAGTFSLYVAVRTIWNNHAAALVSAILLGVHTHFLYAIHWDYADGPALTMLLVSFACLARSTRAARPAPLLIASGFAAAAALSTHLFVILLFPGLGLWYAWTHSGTSRGRFFRGIVFLCSGAVLAFLLFGLISKSFGSDFNYLKPQVDVARTLDTSPWRQSNREWVESATWLAFPAMAVLVSAGVIFLAWKRRRRNLPLDPEVSMLALAGLVVLSTAAIFLYVELRKGLALQQNFYASFLIPYTFLVLGGALSVSILRLPPHRWLNAGITPAALVLSVASFITASFHLLPGCTPSCSLIGPMGLALLGAAAGIILSIAFRNALAVIVTIALIGIVNGASNEYFPRQLDRKIMHDRFLMVYDANAALEPFNRDGELRFWYDRDEPLVGTFLGIASLQLWGFRLISDSFPSLTYPDSRTDSNVLGQTIAVLTQHEDALSKAVETLRLKGIRAESLFHDRVQRGDEAFNVFVIKATPSDRIDLSSLKFESRSGTATSSKDGSIQITGAATPWAYAAILHLPSQVTQLDGVSPIFLGVRLTVSGEAVGVGVLTNDGGGFVDHQDVRPTGVPRDIYLRLPSLDAGHDLVIRTLSRPRTSDIRIESVSLSGLRTDSAVQR